MKKKRKKSYRERSSCWRSAPVKRSSFVYTRKPDVGQGKNRRITSEYNYQSTTVPQDIPIFVKDSKLSLSSSQPMMRTLASNLVGAVVSS
jgi:hypothetical protein